MILFSSSVNSGNLRIFIPKIVILGKKLKSLLKEKNPKRKKKNLGYFIDNDTYFHLSNQHFQKCD